MIVIFAFSHQPYSGKVTEKYFGGANVPIRKMGHVTEFMVLFLLVRWALTSPRRENENGSADTTEDAKENENGSAGTTDGAKDAALSNSIAVSPAKLLLLPSLVAFIFAISYAATDEWHQSFVPGRSSNWNDVAVDACGVSAGAILLAIAQSVRKKRSD